MKRRTLICTAVLSMLMLSGCGERIPKNTVFSIDDLEGKVIGVQLETVGDNYASEIKDAEVERFSKCSGAVNALREGTVDAVILDLEPARYFTNYNNDIVILDETFDDEEYAIAVSKGNGLKDKLNSALEVLREDGTLDSITSNWIGDDKGKTPYVSPESEDEEVIEKEILVMATNAEFPPYEFMEGDDIVGFDVDMMKAVCDVIGMELRIENMEFDSVIGAVNSGLADVGVAGITITGDRLETVDFTDPYTTSTQVVIVRKK